MSVTEKASHSPRAESDAIDFDAIVVGAGFGLCINFRK